MSCMILLASADRGCYGNGDTKLLEENNIKRLKSVLEERADGVVPRESVEYDEELRNEINQRLLEYKHMDILNEGDTIKSIESLRTTQIYYRWAYLVKFEGMKYPMVVMQGNKSICNVNAESIKNGNYGTKVVQHYPYQKQMQLF